MIRTLGEVAPGAIRMNGGLLLEPFESLWSVMRPAITRDCHYSFLCVTAGSSSLDVWSEGSWDDSLLLAPLNEAAELARGRRALAANFADVIRRGRVGDWTPRHASSWQWWEWLNPAA